MRLLKLEKALNGLSWVLKLLQGTFGNASISVAPSRRGKLERFKLRGAMSGT